MPGLVPGIHGTPTERQPLLNSRVFRSLIEMDGFLERICLPQCSRKPPPNDANSCLRPRTLRRVSAPSTKGGNSALSLTLAR